MENKKQKLVEKMCGAVEQYSLLDSYQNKIRITEDGVNKIINLVREHLIGGSTLVPDGLYKQMRFESEQFRREHPHDYSDLSQPNIHPHVNSETTAIPTTEKE